MFTELVTVQDLTARLPEPDTLRARCRAFGVLDAVLDLEYAKYHFTAAWQDGVDLAHIPDADFAEVARIAERAGHPVVGAL